VFYIFTFKDVDIVSFEDAYIVSFQDACFLYILSGMRWLRPVESIRSYVSCAEYVLFKWALLQKRPMIYSILLTKATPYVYRFHKVDVCPCDTPQHTATHRNTQQHTATHRNTLQHAATHCNRLQHAATHGNTLHHTATRCNTLQHAATHCTTLQHAATRCNTLQHTAKYILMCIISHFTRRMSTLLRMHCGARCECTLPLSILGVHCSLAAWHRSDVYMFE